MSPLFKSAVAALAALLTLVVASAVAAHAGGRANARGSAAPAARPVPAPTSVRKIDEYGNIPFGDEKARLDNLAIELRSDPTAKGYIVGYGGRRARVGEARRRIERAKNYLVASMKIAPERIQTIDGGYRENLTVELYVFPPGSGPPYVSPTVHPEEVRFVKTRPGRRPKR